MRSKTSHKVASVVQKLMFEGIVLCGVHSALAQVPQVVIPPVGALSTLPQSNTLSTTGPNVLNDTTASFAPPLKFRDASKALTLGEISDMQAQKSNADTLRKFGYTDIEPIRPKPVATTLVKPVLSIKTLAIWGTPNKMRAEILVNGALQRVKGDETVAPNLRVVRVRANGVEFEFDKPYAASSPKARKSATTGNKESVFQRVSVGQSLEIPL